MNFFKHEKLSNFALYFAVIVTIMFLSEGVARFVTLVEKPTQSFYRLLDAKYIIASNLTPQAKPLVVILGSSLIARGIFPEIVQFKLREAGIAVDVVNLAVPAQNQLEAVELLKYVLTRVKPTLVLCDYDPLNSTNLMPEPVARDSYLSRCEISSPTKMSARLLCRAERLSYLVRFRSQWKADIGRFFKLVFDSEEFRRESMISLTDGALSEVSHLGSAPVMNTFPYQFISERIFGYIKGFAESGPRNKLSMPSNKIYEPLLKFTVQSGVNYALVWLPHYRNYYDRYFYTEKYNQSFYSKYLKEFTQTNGATAIDLNHLSDDAMNFDDVRHLNAYGAIQASRLLAETLIKEPYKTMLSGK